MTIRPPSKAEIAASIQEVRDVVEATPLSAADFFHSVRDEIMDFVAARQIPPRQVAVVLAEMLGRCAAAEAKGGPDDEERIAAFVEFTEEAILTMVARHTLDLFPKRTKG